MQHLPENLPFGWASTGSIVRQHIKIGKNTCSGDGRKPARSRGRKRLANSLDAGNVNLHGGGPAQQFHGHNQAKSPFCSDQHPFEALQRARDNHHTISALEKRMRLDPGRFFNDAANRGDLLRRNDRGEPARFHNADDSGSAQNLQLAVDAALNKHVAGEQGKLELRGTSAPEMRGTIERKENSMPLTRKRPRGGFLILIARMQRVPIVCGFKLEDFGIFLRGTHKAPPCDCHCVIDSNNSISVGRPYAASITHLSTRRFDARKYLFHQAGES